MTSTATPRTNAYGGKCRKPACGQWVEPNTGVLVGSRGAWGAEHKPGECPAAKPAVVHAVPDLGYYVRADGAAIKVVESKRLDDHGNPRRYGVVFTPRPGQRPVWAFVKGAGISVASLTPMTASDAAQLGLSHGHCINCCAPLGGATLSAAVSAIIGYGETCAGNNGWPYPKGVRDQRAFIAVNGS